MFYALQGSTILVPAGVMGLVKPNGSPTMLANGLGIIFYAFDTGTVGRYSIPQDCAPGHVFNPTAYWNGASTPNIYPSAPQNDPDLALEITGTTAYGTGTLWGGSPFVDGALPGTGALVGYNSGFGLDDSDAMRTAVNLHAAGANAAFTMFATHLQVGAGSPNGGLICGRGMNLDSGYWICALLSDTANHVTFAWSSATDALHPASIGSADACGIGNLCTTIVNCVNQDASGTNTKIEMYVSINGATPVLEASATGQTVCDVSRTTAAQEDQFQIGTGFHSGAGQQFNTFSGYNYQCGIATKASGWNASDRASFAANPFQYLRF